MKSLLLTYHFNYNYGAILQTYASIKVLKKMRIDIELPNHKPKMILPMTSFFRGLDNEFRKQLVGENNVKLSVSPHG